MSRTAEERIKAALVGDPSLAGVIGTRVFIIQLPENVIKSVKDPSDPIDCAITYQMVDSTPAAVTQDGITALRLGRLSVIVWCTDYLKKSSITAMVKSVMRQLNLTDGSGRPSILIMERSGMEPNTEPPIFKDLVDFQLHFLEEAA